MTAQIEDKYRYKGKDYALIAMTEPIEFNPEDYGFIPVSPHTACWRGYVCHFGINDKQLYLSKLRICCGENPYPVFEGVSPVKEEKDRHFMVYKNLHHVIDYTGSIVVGTGFLDRYYIHMGFQRAWAYKNVYELKFENGRMIQKIDHSEMVAEIRKKIDEDPNSREMIYGDIVRFVDESFSLDASVKAWWI